MGLISWFTDHGATKVKLASAERQLKMANGIIENYAKLVIGLEHTISLQRELISGLDKKIELQNALVRGTSFSENNLDKPPFFERD